MSPVVKISPRYTLSFEIVWVVLSGFYLARARRPRPSSGRPDAGRTELRLHGAACRTPNGHGAWSGGAWPVPCVRVRIDPFAHVKLSTLVDSEHSSAIMDSGQGPTSHPPAFYAWPPQPPCEPSGPPSGPPNPAHTSMITHVSEAERGRARPSADERKSPRRRPHLHPSCPWPSYSRQPSVPCWSHHPRRSAATHECRNTSLSQRGGSSDWAGAAPSPWLRRRDGCETSVTSGSNHPFSVL